MKVLIVDDHPHFITGLEAVLTELDADLETERALSVKAAEVATDRAEFDLVLLDLNMPGVKGLDALVRMKTKLGVTPVVVVSGEDDIKKILRAYDLGADGYIPKTFDERQTVEALRGVLSRGSYVPPLVLQYLESERRSATTLRTGALPFTDTQKVVLTHLLQGKPNKIIARDLGIAEGTVKAHLAAIFQILGVSSRLQASLKAEELSLRTM